MELEEMNIFYRHYNLPPDFPVIGILGPHWVFSNEPVSRLHFHNCLEIGLVTGGESMLHINNEVLECASTCITIIPPNVPHKNRGVLDGISSGKWLYVDPIQLLPQMNPRLANEINHFQHSLSSQDCVLDAQEHPEIFQLVSLIIDEMEQKRPHYQTVVRELFYALFLLLLRVSRKGNGAAQPYEDRTLSYIAPALTYIAENDLSDLTVEELAEICHLSTSHFRRLFKQVIGWSPLKYLQIVRLERACVMLYNGNSSVTEIALQAGYTSSSSFRRQFRQSYGVSPNQWYQKCRNEENPDVTVYLESLRAIGEPQGKIR